MGERYRAAHAELLIELAGPGYFALLDALEALVTAPPLTEQARGRVHAVLLPLVDRTWRRTHRLVRAVDHATDARHRETLLHDVRKAAKRARYAANALAVPYGRPARAFASRMKAVQDALGDYQDTVVIRQEILQLAADAERAGEATFTYGRLHSGQEQRGALSEAEFARCWQRASRPALRAWLS
jgi:CHAD domain-containing protein